jgi:ribosomal protein L29
MIPPEAYERLSALDACLERLRRATNSGDPELVQKVRQVRKLAAQLRTAMQAIDRAEGEDAA